MMNDNQFSSHNSPIYPPLAFVYEKSGQDNIMLTHLKWSEFNNLLKAFVSGCNYSVFRNCTYLFKAELISAALEYRANNKSFDRDMIQTIFGANVNNTDICSAIILLKEFYTDINRFFIFEKKDFADKKFEIILKREHQTNTGQTGNLDDYIDKILNDTKNYIKQLNLDHEVIINLFEELNNKNLLSEKVKNSIVDLSDSSNVSLNTEIKYSLYDDVFEKIFIRYRELYCKNVTDGLRNNYPVYDIYVNCKSYFAAASKVLNASEYSNIQYREQILEEIKKLFMENINEQWVKNLCSFFYTLYVNNERDSNVIIIQLVEYFKKCVYEILLRYYKNSNDDNVVDTNNFAQNFKIYNLNKGTETHFKVNYQNKDTFCYIFTEHSRSKSTVYFSFNESSYCANLTVNNNEISICNESVEILKCVASSFSCNLEFFNLPVSQIVDSIVKIVAFEFNTINDFV